jgi:hypothetical protein
MADFQLTNTSGNAHRHYIVQCYQSGSLQLRKCENLRNRLFNARKNHAPEDQQARLPSAGYEIHDTRPQTDERPLR